MFELDFQYYGVVKMSYKLFFYQVLFQFHYLFANGVTERSSSIGFSIEPSSIVKVLEHGSTDVLTVDLECKIDTLHSDQKISWLKNGIIISDDLQMRPGYYGRYRIDGDEVDGVYNLKIHPVSVLYATIDSGDYRCAVLRRHDESVVRSSRTAKVSLYVTPRSGQPLCRVRQELTVSDNGIAVIEGKQITLSCQSDLGIPPATITWSKDDKDLIISRSGFDQGLLFFDYDWIPNRLDMNAQFRCNMYHPAFSYAGHLRVDTACIIGPFDIKYRPTVTFHVKSHTSLHGNNNVTLECIAEGNPSRYTYHWSYNATNADENFKTQSDGRFLTLLNVNTKNYFHITCKAGNTAGNGTASVLLNEMLPSETTIATFTTLQGAVANATKEGREKFVQEHLSATDNSETLVIGVVVIAPVLVILMISLISVYIVKKRNKNTSTSREVIEPNRERNDRKVVKSDSYGYDEVYNDITPYAVTELVSTEDAAVSTGSNVNDDNSQQAASKVNGVTEVMAAINQKQTMRMGESACKEERKIPVPYHIYATINNEDDSSMSSTNEFYC